METFFNNFMTERILDEYLPEEKGRTNSDDLLNFFEYQLKFANFDKKEKRLKMSLVELIDDFISNEGDYGKNSKYDST